MKRVIFILLLGLLFLGAGCAQTEITPASSDKLRQALYAFSNDAGWNGDVIERQPSEENHFGNSLILNGPFKQENGGENVFINSIEIISFKNPEYAQRAYGDEECFKGKGEPYGVYGIFGCCLNDKSRVSSEAVMQTENFIVRSHDYFHADCGAGGYLKKFWAEYLKQ